MNFILNEKKINLNNIILFYKKDKIKILYDLNNIKISGIPLSIPKNKTYYIKKNNMFRLNLNNDDIIFSKLKIIDNYLNENIKNYYSFIKNNSIQIKFKKKIKNNLYFSLTNLKYRNNLYYLNIFQI